MKNLVVLLLAAVMVMVIGISLAGCSTENTTTPPLTPGTTQPTTPTTTPPESTKVAFMELAEDFIKNSSTFKFDGVEGSIKLLNSEEFGPTSSFRSSVFTFEFETAHPGHGDRTGLVLAQVITVHQAVIYVDIDNNAVKIAVCDNIWDMLKDQALPVTVSGIVKESSVTPGPDGPMDAPKTFTYIVEKEDGSLVNVSYRGYPPSPAGDAARKKITLDFYNGEIAVGDYMEARGMLNEETGTVVVAEEGDYIKTLAAKP